MKWMLLVLCLFSLVAQAGGPAVPAAPVNVFDPEDGAYINANVGLMTMHGYDWSMPTTVFLAQGISTVQITQKSTFDYTWGLAVGYADGDFMFDFSYHDFNFKTFETATTRVFGDSTMNYGLGRVTSYVYLLNGYYSLYHLFNMDDRTVPYLGAGIGWSENHMRYRISTLTNPDGARITLSNPPSKRNFAWRVMLGLRYYLTNDFFMDLRYSFLYAGDIDYGDTVIDIVNGGQRYRTIDGNNEYPFRSNMFTLGLTHII
ncbi:MAG: porin family protein [Coxiellaceae bacterium]|nr:porin family protein [Coxiellaceae bacterium]